MLEFHTRITGAIDERDATVVIFRFSRDSNASRLKFKLALDRNHPSRPSIRAQTHLHAVPDPPLITDVLDLTPVRRERARVRRQSMRARCANPVATV